MDFFLWIHSLWYCFHCLIFLIFDFPSFFVLNTTTTYNVMGDLTTCLQYYYANVTNILMWVEPGKGIGRLGFGMCTLTIKS